MSGWLKHHSEHITRGTMPDWYGAPGILVAGGKAPKGKVGQWRDHGAGPLGRVMRHKEG